MTKCPSCGKEITGPGYEFGEGIRTACYECSCGTRVYVDRTPEGTLEKLGLKKDNVRERHKRRFHCRVCNEIVVRKRSEKDELSALRRHYREAHRELPLPNSVVFADCDLTKNERESLESLREYVAHMESVLSEVMRELKEKGYKVPKAEDKEVS